MHRKLARAARQSVDPQRFVITNAQETCPRGAAVRKSLQVRKVLADMHVSPDLTRWTIRVVLALVVAGAIAWVPSGSDERAMRLREQLRALGDEAVELRASNRGLASEVEALRSDRRAIEDHARDELGMVYPGEMVLKLESAP